MLNRSIFKTTSISDMIKKLKRNLIPFLAYHLFFGCFLVLFGGVGGEILYVPCIIGSMVIHVFVVFLLIVNDFQKTEPTKWNNIDLLILLASCFLFIFNLYSVFGLAIEIQTIMRSGN